MRVYCILFFLSMSLLIKGQNKDSLYYNKNGKLLYEISFDSLNKPILQIFFYKTQKAHYIYPLKNNIVDGVVKEYSKDGCLRKEKTYKNGVLQGKTYFYLNNCTFIYDYNNNVKEPIFHVINYYNDGTVKTECNNRLIEGYGLFRDYYKNGKLRTEGNYNGVKRNGEWRFYNKDGSLRKTKKYNMKYVFWLKQIF